MRKAKVYLYGWIGPVGGAATKIVHWLRLLHEDYDITMVPADPAAFRDAEATSYLKFLGVRYADFDSALGFMDGVVLAVCEPGFFSSGRATQIRNKGVKIIWSNEMTWLFDGEQDAISAGLIDRVVYVSHFQREAFRGKHGNIDYRIIENYIDARDFKYHHRSRRTFTLGRLSRPDPAKFSEDFPVLYEELGLERARFRIMAWDEQMQRTFAWHHFGPEWELLAPGEMLAWEFLETLDMFVYTLSSHFRESWGRAVVEAMLTGCPVLVPAGHYFERMLVHGESGFICKDFSEYHTYAQALWRDSRLMATIGANGAEHARTHHCDAKKQRELWIEALTF